MRRRKCDKWNSTLELGTAALFDAKRFRALTVGRGEGLQKLSLRGELVLGQVLVAENGLC